ncbi:MocR-like pyridoxine biosynthesis transcription factor PdxR [Caproiciproducens sp. CPB-2]|uniref:MocR-like pyridoxine biosynthesis transcription factor PdxR n=1 Tax=Caproiciproducens sp. CPB-2 TaxID=3030017 RepID=UPI0023DC9961|nr:PLP-dependent aminotransferase family protein [Caproiciproducens sp. CPB-2]MDF1493163.1 PLP-dependent aminotransferase family protein [Caproiciproducens sp. CPB-2]
MFHLDQKLKEPLYQQLYSMFVKQITLGQFSPGEQLPSTRSLAKDLCISVNTVKTAYFQLALEGYVKSAPGSGYYVMDIPSERLPFTAAEPVPAARIPRDSPRFYQYDLQYGNLPQGTFPSEVWLRYARDILYSQESEQLNQYGDPQGDIELRGEIAHYLRKTRGVNCLPEQVVMTCGAQYSVGIIAHLLENGSIAFEDPGYDVTRREFLNHRLVVHPVPVHEDGIDIETLKESGAELVYITPSHQFPLGSVLPIAKRIQILSWAEQQDAYILEDDYDCELRYHLQPVPALQGVSDGSRVIYMGTFSKLLSPSLRMSYLVLPPALLERYRTVFRDTFCQCSWLQQRVLAHYMEDGHWDRQIRRMVTGNCKKHDLLLAGLKQILPPSVQIYGMNAGTHFVLEIPKPGNANLFIEKAAACGVRVYPALEYWMDKKAVPPSMLLLGYTGLTAEDIPNVLLLLAQAWNTPQPCP